MRVAVTGTPGTGKTSATDRLERDLDVVHLNEVITQEGLSQGVDDERDSTIADLDAVRDWFDGRDDVVVESHLAHHLPVDRVIVLRCHPETIEQRLSDRGESEESAQENAESEALDVILVEAIEEHGGESVYEIETTDRSPEAVATEIEAVIDGDRKPGAGAVSYIDYL
ncbi:adenylate kinase family protein [Halorhabdus salina]|uniref:adenylate kinase family protein n=1 Tax=Halorhabdus salina TaxID=2750670 RepID=UPI0015EEFCA5|nr:adenylate kinase family protein [Halorhabdus salina]